MINQSSELLHGPRESNYTIVAPIHHMLQRIPFLETPIYDEGVEVEVGILDPIIGSTSSYAASRIHADVLYAYDNDVAIFAINATDAHLLATLNIRPWTNIGFRDISVGPCGAGSQGSCIYIGEVELGKDGGYNFIIYKMCEPDTLFNQTLQLSSKLPFR
jgi:hypothetical protein